MVGFFFFVNYYPYFAFTATCVEGASAFFRPRWAAKSRLNVSIASSSTREPISANTINIKMTATTKHKSRKRDTHPTVIVAPRHRPLSISRSETTEHTMEGRGGEGRGKRRRVGRVSVTSSTCDAVMRRRTGRGGGKGETR